MPKLNDYVCAAAAAEYLSVAQNSIRKWAAPSDSPPHRIPANGYRLFKRSDFDKFLLRSANPVNEK